MPAAPATILYVGARLPALSETFVYREVLGLRARGRRVLIASIRRPADFGDDEVLAGLASEAMVVYDWRTIAALPVAAIRNVRLIGGALHDAAVADHSSLKGRAKHVVQALAGIAMGRRLRHCGIGHVHAHMANVPAMVALYVARALGVPFSFTGHAADLFVQRAALAFKLDRASFVASISQWHQRFYNAVTPLPPTRTPLVRCSVALPMTGGDGERDIVAVARLVPKKGIDMLIEAFARASLPGWTLRILGDGPERSALVRQAAALGIAERVAFEGARPHAACLEAMARAGIVVLPCRTASDDDRDGIPVVLMEAMAAGRAVIAGDLPTIRELIEDGTSGMLAPPDDVPALGALIEELATDPARRRELGAAARHRVAAEFGDALNLSRLEAAFAGAGTPA